MCSGTFADIDFNGWTWASIEDVAELFSTFTLNPVTLDSVYDEVDSAWAPVFLDMFTPTYADGAFEIAWGLTRDTFETQSGETNAYAPQIMNAWNTEFPDRASLQNSFPLDLTTMFLGSWLHREAVAPVPLPGALGLLGVATALLGALRRRATCAF